MVRNSLNIENRICFDSDKALAAVGPSDEDLDQNLQQDIAMANIEAQRQYARGNYSYQDNFDRSSDDNQALIGATRDILAADRLAQSTGADRNNAIRGAERFAGQTNSVRGALNNAMNAAPNLGAPAGNVSYETFDNSLARQRLAQQLAVAQAFKPDEMQDGIMGILGYNTPKNVLNTIQSQAGQFMMPRISSALENPNMTAVYGANNRVTGAANEFGQLIEGTDPMNSLGGDSGGGSGDDQMASIMPPIDDGSGGGGGGGGIGEIPSDELALNYLQNPYYAYSGFGNQYNPYGFASGTLVDLLQTRGMTQPDQADTLGLFGNPRSFS
jgi:hypothetical protein